MALDFLINNNFIMTAPGVDAPVISNPSYVTRMGASIDASNMLHLTFSMHKLGVQMTSNLGTCSYSIYDKFGVAVSGLTQSGITVDGNGFFIATPVSAASIQDLTHYSIRVTVQADSVARTSVLSLNIGE